jgi:anti-sigma factor RsiW
VVYRHGGHTISLTTLRGSRTVSGGSIAGYTVRTWREGEFTYVAVADLPDADLDRFQRAFLAGLSR